MQEGNNRPVLLFDGVCNLCAGSVQFIIKRDKNETLRFASLQSDAGRNLLEAHHLPANHLKSLVLIEKGRAFTRSTGALRVARYLNGAWPLLYAFIVIPPVIRDAVYDWIGKNRYKWFGEKSECWVPTPALKSRFLT
jgi:predicted DCC family thiol-disulfide oxidoreductase YuxK